MTVGKTASVLSYNGNGSQKVFAWSYDLIETADLKVYSIVTATGVRTLHTEGVDYTVVIAADNTSATVTMTTAPATGTVLYLDRWDEILNATDYDGNGTVSMTTHEASIDKLTMLIQQFAAGMGWTTYSDKPIGVLQRSTTVTNTWDALSLELTNLLDPVSGQSAATRTWVTGQIANAVLTGTLSDANDLPVTADGTTKSRDLSARWGDRFSVLDFSGTTTVAIQAAIDAAIASSDIKTVYFPPGTYNLEAMIDVDGNDLTLYFESGAKITADAGVTTFFEVDGSNVAFLGRGLMTGNDATDERAIHNAGSSSANAHLTVDGLKFNNFGGACVWVNCDYLTVQNNFFLASGGDTTGVTDIGPVYCNGGSNAKITNNKFVNSGGACVHLADGSGVIVANNEMVGDPTDANSGHINGVIVKTSTDDGSVSSLRNIIADNLVANSKIEAIIVSGGGDDVITGNICWNTYKASGSDGISVQGTKDTIDPRSTTITNNVIGPNMARGLELGKYDSGVPVGYNCGVINASGNTLIKCPLVVIRDTDSGTSTVRVGNFTGNIFYGAGAGVACQSDGTTSRFSFKDNIYYRVEAKYIYEGGNIVSDGDQFIDCFVSGGIYAAIAGSSSNGESKDCKAQSNSYTVTADNTTDKLTITTHKFESGEAVRFTNSGGGLPAGIVDSVTIAFTDINTTTDIITATAHGLKTGNQVRVTTDDTMPAELNAQTYYYVIEGADANSFKLATSLANADTATAIDFSDQGAGNHTFHVNYYVVRTSDGDPDSQDTFKIARSAADAIASTPTVIDITTNGTGTHTCHTGDITRSLYQAGSGANWRICSSNDFEDADASLPNLTIASGAITITHDEFTVDTESAAASDDLDTINGGFKRGQVIILRALNSARTVVAKDGTGNLKLAGDFSLDNTEDILVLRYDGRTPDTWAEISRSDNGA